MVRPAHQACQLQIHKRHYRRPRRMRSIALRSRQHGYAPFSLHIPPFFPITNLSTGLFLSSMAYLEGSSVKQRLNDAYVPGLTKNFMVWPWVQFTNFKYVPMEHRVLVVNIISLGWNCYLSFLNSGGGKLPNLPPGHTKEGGELPPS
jgi:hypothetical protein